MGQPTAEEWQSEQEEVLIRVNNALVRGEAPLENDLWFLLGMVERTWKAEKQFKEFAQKFVDLGNDYGMLKYY